MTDVRVLSMPLPDAGARAAVQEELDTNLLVEAGAGSGKTTELVNRMVAIVATGTDTVDRIAAVTFTRKAAGELRERFQARLEDRLRAETDPEVRERLARGLHALDRAFIGTIHAFCARLLRERPLEVGLDPGFRELPVEEIEPRRKRFWEAYLERLVREGDPALEELTAARLRPGQLFALFEKVVENPDVEFPAEEAAAPPSTQVAAARKALGELVEKGIELMPDPPTPDRDSLQRKLRALAFTRDVTGWKEDADLFEALDTICKPGPKGHDVTQNRWKLAEGAKEVRDEVNEFAVGPEAPGSLLLNQWYAHRYRLVLRLTRQAAREYAEHRRRTGGLDFQDLLVLTARLLRESPDARAELGRSWRRLLVDEFQDTDPLQAEIMLLLASDPREEAGDAPEPEGDEAADVARAFPDWRTAVPRPGALFVVGDPKQSIYRFRRADILLYELVKRRFEEFGRVVELTANFRSRPPIGDLVNQVFDDAAFFPTVATSEQARFEPLNTRPAGTPAPAEGVFMYGLDKDPRRKEDHAEEDAALLATWIGDRIRTGERAPGDFMILTRVKHRLHLYARALEVRGIPIQVTGAGVGVEEELRELIALLECMIDPGNAVKVATVLVGLFFGLDLERLTEHRLGRGGLDARKPGTEGDPEVLEALRRLHGWWRRASTEPADIFVARIASELGLLPYAAAGELGSIRAGALVFALDAVRAAALAGDASLPGALDALQRTLTVTEAEAPLEPGRADVVRLMNLHQAKGLEAEVVVLADPVGGTRSGIDVHVERDELGRARGYLRVTEPGKWGRSTVLARPVDWEEKEEAERRFENAEHVRLLYVAVTRARDEVVVARREKSDASPWALLDPWLVANAEALELVADVPGEREKLELPPQEASRRVDEARRRLEELSRPTYRHVTVTQVAKRSDVEEAPAPATPPEEGAPTPTTEFRGYSWGSAVHGALATAAADPPESSLLATCRALLIEHERPLDDHGEPLELQELLGLVHSVRASALWERAAEAERVLTEIPFAAPGVTRPPPDAPPEPPPAEPDGRPGRQLDLFGAGRIARPTPTEEPEGEDEAVPSVLEGVVDLAFKEPDGWVIADYKTDVGGDPDFGARAVAYRRQVELYADAWARLTGEPVKEKVLFFTSQGRVESW